MRKAFCSFVILSLLLPTLCSWRGAKVQAQDLKVTVITPRLLRLQYDRNAEADASVRIQSTAGERRYERDGFLFIETDSLTLRYRIDAEVHPESQSADELRITFPLNRHNVVWYPGKDNAMNLRGTLPPGVTEPTDVLRDSLSMGIVSRAGWSVMELQPTTSQTFDWLFLGYGNDYLHATLAPLPAPYDKVDTLRLPEETSWASLAFTPYLVATATNARAAYQGLSWDKPLVDSELYARYMQLSAFLPDAPQTLPDSIIEQRIDSCEMRYAFLKAFNLQREFQKYKKRYAGQREPFVCPLYYLFPYDNEAYVYEDQFMCGPYIMVAPITRPVQADGKARRSVWLPPGQWRELYSCLIIYGPKLLQVECAPNEIPVYVRKRP